jgi:hypothetical protein
VVLALGQEADLSLLDGVPGLEVDDGVVQVDERMMTGYEGIFAGGDMVPAERTVTVGVGHGKQAAWNIDAWLRGSELTHPAVGELADFPTLNTWYYSDDAARTGLRGWWASPPRSGLQRLINPWEYRHLRAFGVTRIAGSFVAATAGVVCLSYAAYGWGAFFLVIGVLNLAGGYWYITIARSSPPRA